MPRIPEITAQDTALHPTEVGIEANTQAAYRAGRFYNEAGEALKRAAQDKAAGAKGIAAGAQGIAAGAQGIVRGTEALGRSVGGVTNSAAQGIDQAEQFAAHMEINHGVAALAQGGANLIQSWNDTVKNADPNAAGKLQQQFMGDGGAFQQWATNYVDGFNTPDGKAWARDQVAHLRAHMFEKTSADMMTMAADAVDKNITQSARAWSNTARGDPSAVPFLLDSAQKSIDAMIASSPNLSGVAAVKARTEILDKAQKAIVRAGGLGAIENAGDPDAAAAAWAKRYPNFVDATEIDQFAKAAKYYQRLNVSESRAARVQRDYVNKQDFNKQADALLASTIPQNVGDSPQLPKDYWDQARKLATHPGAALEPGRLQTIVHTGEAITERLQRPNPARDDPATVDGLMPIIQDPNKSADDAKAAIIMADRTGTMTPRTRSELIQLATDVRNLKDPFLERDLEAAKAIVEPKFGGVNSHPGAYAKFYYDFVHNQYLPAKMAGKLPSNALDMNDPQSMISQALTKATGGPQKTLPAAIGGNGGIGAVPVYTAPKGGAPAKPAAVPTVKDKAGYDALPAGERFIGPDGKPYVKPAATGPAT